MEGPYAFLSNFYGEKHGKSVEHFFQAAKMLSTIQYQEILNAPTPGKAKRLGRKYPIRPDWDYRRTFVMREALESKFEDSELRGLLLETGRAILIEGNTWHDNYWGDCKCGGPNCAAKGNNALGKLLMMIRDELRYNANQERSQSKAQSGAR